MMIWEQALDELDVDKYFEEISSPELSRTDSGLDEDAVNLS